MIIVHNDMTDAIVKREIKADAYKFNLMDKGACRYYVDLGANHGLVYKHLIASGFVFEKAVLLEPLWYNFNILTENLAMYKNLADFHALNKCFGPDEKEQHLSFFKSNNTGATQFDVSGSMGNSVPSVTLDRLVHDYGINPKELLIKCDCEQAERYLLARSNLDVAKSCAYLTGEFHSGSKKYIELLHTHMEETHTLFFEKTQFFIAKK